jgi:hypothetical protein
VVCIFRYQAEYSSAAKSPLQGFKRVAW